MKSLALGDGTFEALRGEIMSTPRTRYQHRLHAVLLVAGGLSCRRAAELLGDSARSVENWVNLYNLYKTKGLKHRRQGRPPRVNASQAARVRIALAGAGPRRWSGARLAAFLAQSCGVKLGVRQAQRVLARLGRGKAV